MGEDMSSQALGLGGIASRDCLAAKEIRSSRNGLKVFGVDAMPHATKVVKVEALGNGADKQFVGDAMRVLPIESRIPVVSATALPFPTAGGRLNDPLF